MLQVLPPFNNSSLLIEGNQNVPDIIREVLEAHVFFASDYDLIYQYFDKGSIKDICKSLFDFCKKNIVYKIEPETEQTTKSPSALIAMGYGDCKHYAGFIAGVLSAITRNTGKQIDWRYRFASYNMFVREPGHVFVVVFNAGNEYWIDPVLSRFDERLQPAFVTDKKINMPLYRVSGLKNDVGYLLPETEAYLSPTGELIYQQVESPVYQQPAIPIPDIALEDIPDDMDLAAADDDANLSPEILQAIELLLYYNVIDTAGNFNDTLLLSYSSAVPGDVYEKMIAARELLASQAATVSGFLQTIFRGVKKVTLSLPRGAYLSLVALNVFGTATRLKQATSTTEGANKVRNLWYKFGGDWKNLRSAIDNGSKRKRIMGIGAAPAIPAWVAAASAIIAAMTPLLTSILRGQQQQGLLPSGFDPALINQQNPVQSNSIMDFIKNNIVLIGLGAAAIVVVYNYSQNKKR